MSALDTLPPTLRPYEFHGVRFLRIDRDEASAACPFCDREGKFEVNVQTGQYKCWVCEQGNKKGGGNAYVFMRLLHEQCMELTQPADYAELAESRGYLDAQVLIEWGVCKSFLTGNWLIPGYNADGKLTGLYQLIGRRLLPTPLPEEKGHIHALHGVLLFDRRKQTVLVCEGPWDGMALYELLSRTKRTDEGLRETANRSASLLTSLDCNVLAVPGANTFFERWLPLFAGKIVWLLYDNDHERRHGKTGKMVEPAGLHGMQRTARMLRAAAEPPRELHFMQWDSTNFWSPALPSGFDLRDLLTRGVPDGV